MPTDRKSQDISCPMWPNSAKLNGPHPAQFKHFTQNKISIHPWYKFLAALALGQTWKWSLFSLTLITKPLYVLGSVRSLILNLRTLFCQAPVKHHTLVCPRCLPVRSIVFQNAAEGLTCLAVVCWFTPRACGAKVALPLQQGNSPLLYVEQVISLQ